MIESYSFGSIIIDGKRYSSDVIIFPDRVRGSWWRKEGHSLCKEDIEEIIAEKPEVLVIGMGDSGLMQVPAETREYIESQGIELIVKRTEEASKTYNELSPLKRVIAAFHLTC